MSLTEKLAQLRVGSAERIPSEHLRIMHQATDDLRESGILEGVIQVGSLAPAFELPNITGQTIRSADLLDRGPLVVTFYRGFW